MKIQYVVFIYLFLFQYQTQQVDNVNVQNQTINSQVNPDTQSNVQQTQPVQEQMQNTNVNLQSTQDNSNQHVNTLSQGNSLNHDNQVQKMNSMNDQNIKNNDLQNQQKQIQSQLIENNVDNKTVQNTQPQTQTNVQPQLKQDQLQQLQPSVQPTSNFQTKQQVQQKNIPSQIVQTIPQVIQPQQPTIAQTNTPQQTYNSPQQTQVQPQQVYQIPKQVQQPIPQYQKTQIQQPQLVQNQTQVQPVQQQPQPVQQQPQIQYTQQPIQTQPVYSQQKPQVQQSIYSNNYYDTNNRWSSLKNQYNPKFESQNESKHDVNKYVNNFADRSNQFLQNLGGLQNGVNTQSIIMYPGNDNKMHIQQSTRNGGQLEEEDDSIEIDESEDIFSNLLNNLFQNLDSSNPFAMLTDDDEQNDVPDLIDLLDDNLLDLQNSSMQNLPLELDKEQHLSTTPKVYKIPQDILENKYLVVSIKGQGTFEFEIYDQERDKVLHEIGKVRVYDKKRDKLIPISTKIFRDYKDYYFRLKPVTIYQAKGVQVILSYKNFINLKFQQTIKIETSLIHTLKVRVTFKQDSMDDLNEMTRLQFILKSNLGVQDIKGNEKLSMYINKSKSFPTREKYEMQATGSLNGGLIKTINSHNESFCINKDCVYSIMIKVRHINQLTLFASNANNGQVLEIKDHLHLVEELEPGEQVRYIFKVPEEKKNYLFSLYPTENNTVMHVQPDTPPEQNANNNFKGYRYMSYGQGISKMVITQREMDVLHYQGNLFYVAFEAKNENEPTTFYFDFKIMDTHQMIKLEANEENSGLIVKKDTAQYYLDLFNGEPETFDISIEMITYGGQGQIFLKECPDQDKNCELLQSDFSNNPQKFLRLKSIPEQGKDNVQKMNLKVNCLGNDPFEDNDKYEKNYPLSVSCKFIIAVLNPSETFVNYQLKTKGNTVLKQLQVGRSHTVTLNPFEESNFKFTIKKNLQFENILFKYVSLVGDCTIYIHNKNMYPSEDDNLGKLEIKNKNLTSISTKTFNQLINKKFINVSDYIYLSIFADSYTVLDIYTDYVYFKVDNVNQIAEKLKLGQIAYRSIQEKDSYKDEQGDVYYKDFVYFLSTKLKNSDFFDIQLNSEVMGLEMCVQLYNYFDPIKQCDFQTSTENLKINTSNGKYRSQQPFFIRVYKKVSKDDFFENFPIQFNLLLHTDQKNQKIQTLQPGQIISKKLDAKESAVFQIQLQKESEKTTILFTSHNYFLRAKVKNGMKSTDKIIQTLTHSNFGMRIENEFLFKKKYCSHVCKIYIEVQNSGSEAARFYLGFVHNHTPLILKEGEQIFIPSDRQFYMVTKPKNNNPLEMTYESNFTDAVLYSKIVHAYEIEKRQGKVDNYIQIKDHISENQFDFKSDIGKEGEIIINKNQMVGFTQPQVLYMIQPKFNSLKYRLEGSFAVLNEKDKTSITLHSSVQKLNFNHEVSGHLVSEDFKYYTFNLDEPQDVTIIVTSNTGEMQVYINKGMKNLPTEQSYWKKGDNFKTKEIIITRSEFQNNQDSMVDSYTIGIFAQENCDYNILVMSNFNNLIKIKNQELKSYKLDKLKMYFFDFYSNKINHQIFIYSDQSDVEISFLRYDEGFDEDILTSLEDETNIDKKFIQKANATPYLEMNKSLLNLDAHFIVRARALNSNTTLDVAIYDSQSPLLLKSEDRVTVMQNKMQHQVYKIKLKYDIDQADIDIKIEFGKLQVYVSFNENFEDYHLLEGSMQKSIVLEADKEREKSNDIIIFQEVFIKVLSQEKSKFSIQVKPRDKFRQIKLMETEIVKPLKDKDLYIYFEVDNKMLIDIKTLYIQVETARSRNEKIQYLFNSDQDVRLNSSNPFIDMPIINKNFTKLGSKDVYNIQPKVLAGDYILKIPASSEQNLIKISVTSNDQKKLEVNGEYYEKSPQINEQNKYFIYIPEAGEFRILFEYCADVKIEQAMFEYDDGNTVKINFRDNLFQDYPYILNEDDSSDIKQQVKQLSVPVYRSLVKGPGLLSFVISNTSNNYFNVSTAPKNFFLLTEFKPTNKSLIFKDYIQYYTEKDEFFNFEFIENYSKLQVTILAPKFKKQLQQDYPNLKYILVELRVFLLGDDDRFVKSFSKCGLAIVDRFRPKPQLHTYTIQLSMDDLNKDHKVSFIFGRKELSKMTSFKKLIIYSHARVSFMEHDQNTYYITLDRKFTDVPYYLLKIDNLSQSLSNWSMQQIKFYGSQLKESSTGKSFIGLYFVILIIVIVCLCKQKSERNEREVEKIKEIRDQYIKKDNTQNRNNDIEDTKIEMADI